MESKKKIVTVKKVKVEYLTFEGSNSIKISEDIT